MAKGAVEIFKGYKRDGVLLAVDPSLTCSGWAAFDIKNGRLKCVGEVRALGPEVALGERLSRLQEEIIKIYRQLKLGSADVVICEAPTTMKDPRAAILVEQVRGIFECIARTHDACVPGRINPRSVHTEIMGLRSGKQEKREVVKVQALSLANILYGEDLLRFGLGELTAKHQDIADAILIGALGLSWISRAISANVTLEDFFEGQKRSKVRVGARIRSRYAA